MFTRSFLKATAERALKTAAQVAATLLVGTWTGLVEVDWLQVVSVAGFSAVVSVLTSVGSGAVTGDGPSLTHVETIK